MTAFPRAAALVMQIPEIVDTILDFIPTIDFDQTEDEISLFETTIRYVGGMLSGENFLVFDRKPLNSHRL